MVSLSHIFGKVATIEATSNESFQCHLNCFFFQINFTYCKFVPIYARRSDVSPPTASSRLTCSSHHPVHNAISARTHYAHARRYSASQRRCTAVTCSPKSACTAAELTGPRRAPADPRAQRPDGRRW